MNLAYKISLAVLLAGSHVSTASARSEYLDSAISAISTANGQARLDLNKGTYGTTNGGDRFVIEVPADMGSTLFYDYRSQAIFSASWEFERDIFVELHTGGKCVRIKVKKFAYGQGGFLTGQSDQEIVPTGPCRESEPLARMNDFLRVSPRPGDFFRGSAFVAFPRLRKCTNTSCSTTTVGFPIRKATFFGTTAPDGTPLSAFHVGFKDGSTILLPKNGLLKLGVGSEATFSDLTYDINLQTGSGVLDKFNVVLQDGVLAAGQTVVRFAAHSRLTAEQVAFDKSGASVRLDGGSVSGQLTDGTSILLTNDQTKNSILNITYAKADLFGLSFEGAGANGTLRFKRGVISTKLKQGELWFTERNSIRLGYTNMDLVLGCPESSPIDSCEPLEWSSTSLNVKGSIKGFATTLTGGQFNISNAGLVYLQAGQIDADTLQIDTSNRNSPITGKVNKFEVSLEAQDFHIDESTVAAVAHVDVRANDLLFKSGQTLPIGKVKIAGTVNHVQGGKVGKIRFDAGAQLDLEIERRDGDEPEVRNGTVRGDARVNMDTGGVVMAQVLVDRLTYYRGHGDAQVTITAASGNYVFDTPSAHESKSALGFESDVELKSIHLVPSLAQPLKLGPTQIRASQARWEIDPLLGVAFKLQVPIAEQELVYARVKPPVGGGTLCAPKVNLRAQAPFITGKLDVFAGSMGSKVRVYDGALSAGIDASADDRGCSVIADAVCFLVGAAFGGPIGGAALAMICDAQIDQAKAKLSNTIRDESLEKVRQANFEFNF